METINIKNFLLLLCLVTFLSACKIDNSLNGSLSPGEDETTDPTSAPSIETTKISLSSSSNTVIATEGDTLNFIILFNKAVKQSSTLDWSINSGGSIFSATSGQIALVKGDTSASFTVNVNDDTIPESQIVYDLTITGDSSYFQNELDLSITLNDDDAGNIISVSTLSVSNLHTKSFDAQINFTDDLDANATVTLWYCNDTDNGGCDPEATGTSVVMTRGSGVYTASVSSLATPNDPGDVLKLKVVASDPDGSAVGSPLSTTAALPNALINRTDFETDTNPSFTAIQVDWTNKLAYVGTRQTSQCFKVIDFSNENSPVVVRTVGTGTTPASSGNTCLGLKLFASNTRLAVASDTGFVDVWDLSGSYTRLAAIAATRPKQIMYVDEAGGVNDTKIYVGRRAGVLRLTFNASGPSLTSDWNTGGLSDDHNGSTYSPLGYIFTGGSGNGTPVEMFNTSGTLLNSFNFDNGGSSGSWTGATSTDGTMVFMGGWVSGFLKYTSGGSPYEFSMAKRVDNTSAYRDATYFEDASQKYFVGANAGRTFDFYNVTDINNPVLSYEVPMTSGTGELYGVQINTTTRRLLGVSNRGDFYTIDLDKISGGSNYPITQPPSF